VLDFLPKLPHIFSEDNIENVICGSGPLPHKYAANAAGHVSLSKYLERIIMPQHLIAIDSYGAQRVRAPASGTMVSAYKIGYTTIGRDVLLSLYGSQALDVTPKQASYHYVSIAGATSVHNGFLLLSLTDEELAKVERYTRYHPSSRSGCWRWLDQQWQRFPTAANAEYLPAVGRESPNFDPTRYRPVSPSTGVKVESSDEIRAEKSQRDGQKTWWWLTGNTYPHKDMLKRWGCRWSKGRRAWFFIGESLPDAVQKIVTTWGDSETPHAESSQNEDTPCSDEEAEAILGVKFMPNPALTVSIEHRFEIGQTVYYSGTNPLITEKGSSVTFGFAGTVKELANRTAQAYVDFRWSGQAFVDEYLLSETKPVAPHAFQLGQTVYAAHLLRISDSLKLPADTEGQVIRRYKHRQQDFNLRYAYAGEYAYDVQFVGQPQAYSVFEENLRDEVQGTAIQRDERLVVVPGLSAQAVIEMAIQRRQNIPNAYEILDELEDKQQGFAEGEVVYYIRQREELSKIGKPIRHGDGGTVLMASGSQILVNFALAGNAMMHADDLNRLMPAQTENVISSPCPCEEFGTKGWYPAPKLAEWIKCGICNPDGLNKPNHLPDGSQTQAPLLGEEEIEPIRVIKPESLPDNLQSAIQAAKHATVINLGNRQQSNKISPIGQKYVGELTGSITGQVFCYGFASHNETLLYLNMGGPRMAVEAIRARLAKGEIVNLVPWDAPAIELSAGETGGKANTGMFTAYLNNIPEAKFTSAILVHECLIQPNYKGKSQTAIFRISEEQAVAKLLYQVRQLVNIPVFDVWAGYLYHAGQSAGLLRKPRSAGDVDLLLLDLDAEAWTRLITGGLANGVIQLPLKRGEKEGVYE
jgi:hypothetical protein